MKKLQGKTKKVLKYVLIVLAIFLVIAFFPIPPHKTIGKAFTPEQGVEEASFRQGLGHLVGTPFIGSNKVTTLLNGVQIFPPQIQAIKNAKHTITMENFIFRSGELSKLLIPALSERARAGVQVKVLMDSMGSSKLEEEEIKALQDSGAIFVKYNRTEWHKLFRINHRDHRKLLVVDGQVGYTGGACLADEWMGNAEAKDKWRDTHFQVEGPAVAMIQGVFTDNWIQSEHEVLHGTNFFPELPGKGNTYIQCFKTGPKDGVETARLVYLYAIGAAKKNIRIGHSYFVPDNLLVDALLAARKRGVKVEIITPGIIDANVVRRASRSRWDKLLEAGVEFSEYQPSLFHCKVMIVDDSFVTSGTVNFDNRSFRINDEICINFVDRDLAREHIKIFEADRENSKPISIEEFKKRPFYVKAAEHMAGWFRVWL